MEKFDFSGWATRNDLQCSDGRIIRRDAFKHCNGKKVPLVWNHQHNDNMNVLGHAVLENREEGVYAYCKFNDTESGKNAKLLVEHGDVSALSIYANQLKQQGVNVLHGAIREVSLVLAGANPGAFIDSIISHGEESDEEAIIYSGENISLYHADEKKEDEKEETKEPEETKETEETKEETDKEKSEETKETEETGEKDDESKSEEDEDKDEESDKMSHSDEPKKKTVADVLATLNEEQETAVYHVLSEALKGQSVEEDDADDDEEINHSEGGNETMKQNVFDQGDVKKGNVLSHADQAAILAMAKQSNVGSFKRALQIYAEEHDLLKHADGNVGVFEDYSVLFPELELLKKGEPETIFEHDQSWVAPALRKIHKSPFSRIRTRHADARKAKLQGDLNAKGYKTKGEEKKIMGQIAMISRETTPQTIYIKDALNRDDIIDITDFDIMAYQWKMMRAMLDQTMVLAAMVGDGRDLGDPDKISEEHVRPIWTDDEEYTIHYDVDVAAAKAELQGSNTGANFGENYIYAEAMITAALYSREQFKGTGTPDFYCTPLLRLSRGG